MRTTKLPEADLLRTLFTERDGVLYHREGRVAGYAHRGYWQVRIHRSLFKRSRLIFKLHHGHDPLGVIDHISGNSLDDRIENLRDVVWGENSRNKGNHDGSVYVTQTEGVDRYGNISRHLRITLGIWPDEDIDAIAGELHRVVAPVIDRIYASRRGRARPPSPKVLFDRPSEALRRF
jgi:hypothetical protein